MEKTGAAVPPAGGLMRRRSACIVAIVLVVDVTLFVQFNDEEKLGFDVSGNALSISLARFVEFLGIHLVMRTARLSAQPHRLQHYLITGLHSPLTRVTNTLSLSYASISQSTTFANMCGSDICLGILAIIFPPIAVWVKRGICSADSLINIALCCTFNPKVRPLNNTNQCLLGLGFLPGLLHAWYIISVTPEPTYSELSQQDPESGRVTYYYVQSQPHYGHQGAGGYGTVPNQQFPKPAAGSNGFVAQPQQQGGSSSAAAAGTGASEDVPPSYQQAVGADNKVQHP